MRPVFSFLVAVLFLLPATLAAEESPLAGEAELSMVSKSGNSRSESVFAKGLLQYGFTEKLTGKLSAEATRGEDDGVRSSESYGATARLDYEPRPRFYGFGFLRWFKDNFAGIEARYTLGLGAGYKVLQGPTHKLEVEGGPNFTREYYVEGGSREFLAARLFAGYSYHFTEKNRFFQTLEYLYDFDETKNYNINSETGVVAALNGNFSLKASYLVEYDNQPVPDTLTTTDKTLSVALVANF